MMSDAMHEIFTSERTTDEQKATAFELNMFVADKCNRYHAMDNCIKMLATVSNEHFAFILVDYLRQESAKFIPARTGLISVQSPSIRLAIEGIKK
jgi:hypothetical protein